MVRLAALGQLATCILTLTLAAPAHATSTVYADRAAWEAAVSGSPYTETFDDVPDQYIPVGVGGVMYTPGFDIVIPTGDVLGTSIQGGTFHGDAEEDSEYTFLGYNDIVFHAPVTAIAFDVGGIEKNQGIVATINGEHIGISRGVPGPVPVPFFFGVVSDTPFFKRSNQWEPLLLRTRQSEQLSA